MIQEEEINSTPNEVYNDLYKCKPQGDGYGAKGRGPQGGTITGIAKIQRI